MRSKGQRSRSLGTKMWKSFSTHIFVNSGSIYVKPRPKWSATHSTHIVEYTPCLRKQVAHHTLQNIFAQGW